LPGIDALAKRVNAVFLCPFYQIPEEERDMIKQFKTAGGVSVRLEITEEGQVTYVVGRNKTTFDLSYCAAVSYGERTVVSEDMLTGTGELEPWMWLAIIAGENRLEYNNYHTENRRHMSYLDITASGEEVLDSVLRSLKNESVRRAIANLKPQQQELVRDIFYRGLSMAEVARRDGVYKSSVMKRMARIVKQLKNYLKSID